jgi:hypothetical protein
MILCRSAHRELIPGTVPDRMGDRNTSEKVRRKKSQDCCRMHYVLI